MELFFRFNRVISWTVGLLGIGSGRYQFFLLNFVLFDNFWGYLRLLRCDFGRNFNIFLFSFTIFSLHRFLLDTISRLCFLQNKLYSILDYGGWDRQYIKRPPDNFLPLVVDLILWDLYLLFDFGRRSWITLLSLIGIWLDCWLGRLKLRWIFAFWLFVSEGAILLHFCRFRLFHRPIQRLSRSLLCLPFLHYLFDKVIGR